MSQGGIDTLITEILIPATGGIQGTSVSVDSTSIGNWTSYHIERDFFTPADAFSLTLEDSRADQLNQVLLIGQEIQFRINQQIVMKGFVDSFTYSYGREGQGKKLEIHGRDLLGIIQDATIFPNLGVAGSTSSQSQFGATDFQFKPTDTYQYFFNTVFAPFGATVENNDQLNISLATGFEWGAKSARAKTPKGLASTLKHQLQHVLKPTKGEKVLAYAMKVANFIGAHIKMSPGSDSVITVACPTYDRDSTSPFYINHTSTNVGGVNNAEHGTMHISYADQPSVLILEGTTGTATFKKQNFKVVAVNELTGFDRELGQMIPSVQEAITQLTTGIPTKGGTGYYLIPPKAALYDTIPSTLVGLNTPFSRPEYVLDEDGKTATELQFICAKKMAEYQRKYFSLEYRMHGHTQQNIVWYPNVMCNVVDDAFDPQMLARQFWIEKVNYSKSVTTGTATDIKLSMPYVYEFNIEQLNAPTNSINKVARDQNIEGHSHTFLAGTKTPGGEGGIP